MKAFDFDKSILDREELAIGGEFISEFSSAMRDGGSGLTGSEGETSCARTIRDRIQSESGEKARLEAYRAYPLVGRGAFPLIGIWYAFSLLLYFVSFAGGRLAGILLTALSVFVFLSGGVALGAVFLGGGKLKKLFNTKVSYNVVSEHKPEKATENEKTVIICANHDSVMGSYISDFSLSRKLAFILAPVTVLLFLTCAIIKMAIGADTAAKISVLSIIPALAGVAGILAMVTHFSPFEQHSRPNNGISVSTAMAAYCYFTENPELIPDGVRLVFASFGGENSAHGGSAAFCAAHPEFKDAEVIALGSIESGRFRIAEYDALRKISFSTPMVSAVRSAAHEQDIDLETMGRDGFKQKFNALHGYISNSFARSGIASATLFAKDYGDGGEGLDRSDIECLLALTVGSVKKLFATSAPVKDAEAKQVVEPEDNEDKDNGENNDTNQFVVLDE